MKEYLNNNNYTNFQLYWLELENFISYIFILFLTNFTIFFCYINNYIYFFFYHCVPFELSNYFIITNLTEFLDIQLLFSLLITLIWIFPFFWLKVIFLIKNGLFQFENKKIIKYSILFVLLIFLNFFMFFIILFPNYNYFYLETLIITYQEIKTIYYEPQLTNYFYFFIYFLILTLFFFQLYFLLVVFLNKKLYRKTLYFFLIILMLFFIPISNTFLFIFVFVYIIYHELLIYINLIKKKYIKN